MKDEAKKRKETPVFSGVINYFPDAIREVARVSFVGNEQHNPGSDLFWDRSKSGDELDALARHLVDSGTIDSDGLRHSAKVAWRALANLQKELEREAQEDWEEDIIKETKEIDDLEECDGKSCMRYYCECIHDRRMNVIGQNGNEGLHYDDDDFTEADIPGSIAWDMREIEREESNLEYVTDDDGKGAINYSTPYPGDIKITYDEI